MAARPSRPIFCPLIPPAFASLIPPVNGLFPPTDTRCEQGEIVPAKTPGAITSLLSGPKGEHVGLTSLATRAEQKPLPPNLSYSGGTGIDSHCRPSICIRYNFFILDFPFCIADPHPIPIYLNTAMRSIRVILRKAAAVGRHAYIGQCGRKQVTASSRHAGAQCRGKSSRD